MLIKRQRWKWELVTTDDKPASDIRTAEGKRRGAGEGGPEADRIGSDADSDKTQANADAGNNLAEEESRLRTGMPPDQKQIRLQMRNKYRC